MLSFPKTCASCGNPWTINHHCADHQAAASEINTRELIAQSHYPDLSERLIETHQVLQMSRDYLMEKCYGNPQLVRIVDHLFDAMNHTEQAIDKLSKL